MVSNFKTARIERFPGGYCTRRICPPHAPGMPHNGDGRPPARGGGPAGGAAADQPSGFAGICSSWPTCSGLDSVIPLALAITPNCNGSP